MVYKKNSFEDFMRQMKQSSLGSMFNTPTELLNIEECENEDFKNIYKSAKEYYIKLQDMRDLYFSKKQLAETLKIPLEDVENGISEWLKQGIKNSKV